MSDNEVEIPKEAYVIAQEIQIIKKLSGNNPVIRAKAVRKLQKWLKLRSNSSYQFKDEDFQRIWKGLYFCMWMSDKPLNQEELAESMGTLIDCFSSPQVAIDFFGSFLQTMQTEWFGIDQWRMDKFLMLVRRMLRYTLKSLKKEKWDSELIEKLNSVIYKCLESPCFGLSMHVLDIFFEELAKVCEGKIEKDKVTEFIKPFIKFIAYQKEYKLLAHMRNSVFAHLLYQSELGREYSERYQAWKEMGFPTKSIEDIELVKPGIVDDSKKNGNNSHLDPRAGNVDVFMPILPLDADGIIQMIEEIMYKSCTNSKSRKHLRIILENFKTYKKGIFPLGVKTMPILEKGVMKPIVEDELRKIEKLDQEMHSSRRSLKSLSKKQRKRFLASLDLSEANEDNIDDIINDKLSKSSFSKIKKLQENHSSINDWIEEDITPEDETKAPAPFFKEKSSKVRRVKKKKGESVVQESPAKKPKLEETVETNFEAESHNNKTEQKSVTLQQKTILSTPKNNKKNKVKSKMEPFKTDSDWDAPLKEGETEYFIPSKKIQIKNANEALLKQIDLVPNPFAKSKALNSSPKTPMQKLKAKHLKLSTPLSTGNKKVRIALKQNASQSVAEHIKQVRSSPLIPYDASKLPTKGLLKPNSIPGPINPYYKKKLKFAMNDTI